MCLAIPGKIVEIVASDALTRTGKISFGGVIKKINLAMVPEAIIGDYILAHAGIAIGVIDRAEAEKTLNLLDEIDGA
jgi:hydrogenase expression/formation protein HypC